MSLPVCAVSWREHERSKQSDKPHQKNEDFLKLQKIRYHTQKFGGEALTQKCTHKESKNAKKNREESIRQPPRLQTKSHLSSKTLIRKSVDRKRKIWFVREKKRGKKKKKHESVPLRNVNISQSVHLKSTSALTLPRSNDLFPCTKLDFLQKPRFERLPKSEQLK
jgi:hypothetical protein